MENTSLDPIPEKVPMTIEGIAIHLSYISQNLTKLNENIVLLQGNTVTREEWTQHLARDEDHENRIKVLETTVTKLWAYGTAVIFIIGLLEVLIKILWK